MAIQNGYADLVTYKDDAQLNDSAADAEIERAIEASSRLIDAHAGNSRRFWQDATVKTRTYYPSDRRRLYVDDISTATGLIVKVDTTDDGTFDTTLSINSDFIVGPVNAGADTPARPYEWLQLLDGTLTTWPIWSSGRTSVEVTAKFGWAAVPDAVETACILQAKTILNSHNMSYGAFSSVDGSPVRTPALAPQARQLLEHFVRHNEVDNGG